MSGFDVIFAGNNLARLLGGMWVAAKISLISLAIGLVLGIIFGVLRTFDSKIIRIIFKIYLEFIRIVPLLVLLIAAYYLLPQFIGGDWSNTTVSIVVFIFWIAAEMSDLVRASLLQVPKAQIESGRALGFNRWQIYRNILLPQGLPAVLPAAINLVTRVIKTTSLLLMIGVTELIKVGTQIIENYTVKVPDASLWVYGLIFLMYFLLCYPLSRLAKFLEKRTLGQGGR